MGVQARDRRDQCGVVQARPHARPAGHVEDVGLVDVSEASPSVQRETARVGPDQAFVARREFDLHARHVGEDLVAADDVQGREAVAQKYREFHAGPFVSKF